MTRNFTVVHIEDEYREFLDLVTSVRIMIEDYLNELKGLQTIAETREMSVSSETGNRWAAYEITVEELDHYSFRYIFVRDKIIPNAIINYFTEHRAFIIDVLRPIDNATQLGITVGDSLKSIESHVSDKKKVVLYTAHQGEITPIDDIEMPRKISKDNGDELDRFLSELVYESFQ